MNENFANYESNLIKVVLVFLLFWYSTTVKPGWKGMEPACY